MRWVDVDTGKGGRTIVMTEHSKVYRATGRLSSIGAMVIDIRARGPMRAALEQVCWCISQDRKSVV